MHGVPGQDGVGGVTGKNDGSPGVVRNSEEPVMKASDAGEEEEEGDTLCCCCCISAHIGAVDNLTLAREQLS